MKTFFILLTIIVFTQVSCTNDDAPYHDKKSKSDNIFNQATSDKLKTYFEYATTEITNKVYKQNLHLDSNLINDVILNYDFGLQTRGNLSIPTYTVEEVRSILQQNFTENGYKLLSSIINSKEISFEDLELCRQEATKLDSSEQHMINYIIDNSIMIYDTLILNTKPEVQTRGDLGCEIAVSVCSSSAGWVWGMAIGGPVGAAVGWTISTVGSAILSHYKC
ncbi:hypothetical protein [Bacteroides rodentium]